MQEGIGGIKPTEETYVRKDSREEEAVSHVVGGSLRSQELDGDNSEKDCCVTQSWWLATLVGTRRGLQRKGLLCHTELVARYARRN